MEISDLSVQIFKADNHSGMSDKRKQEFLLHTETFSCKFSRDLLNRLTKEQPGLWIIGASCQN